MKRTFTKYPQSITATTSPDKTLYVRLGNGRISAYKYSRLDGQGEQFDGSRWQDSFIVTPDNQLLIWTLQGKYIPCNYEFWVEEK